MTGRGGGDDGEPDGRTSGDSRRDRRSRRSRRSHRRRRLLYSWSDSSSWSESETVRRALGDFQIPVHKVGDILLNKVTYWHSYHLENENKTLTSRMRLHIKQEWKKRQDFIDRVRFDGTKPAELFSFLSRFVRVCKDTIVWEGKARFFVGSFLTGATAILINKVFPDTGGHIPGRTFAPFPEAVHWLLVSYEDSITTRPCLT